MLGVLPCGGRGLRWGGITKEFLPISANRWLVDHAIDSMRAAGVERFCIATLSGKVQELAMHFRKPKYSALDLFYVVQNREDSMWEAIRASFPYTEDPTLFCMTDTLFDKHAFEHYLSANPTPSFALGTFQTTMPERFGIVKDNMVFDKPVNYPEGAYEAWGAIIWSRAVVREWLRKQPEDYTEAINLAIQDFGLETFSLGDYRDFASWNDYRDWLTGADSNQSREY